MARTVRRTKTGAFSSWASERGRRAGFRWRRLPKRQESPACRPPLGELLQVLQTKQCTPAAHSRGGIRRREVRPANRDGPSRAVGSLHRHPVFAPERPGHHEREAGAPEWMERMGDAYLRCFCSIDAVWSSDEGGRRGDLVRNGEALPVAGRRRAVAPMAGGVEAGDAMDDAGECGALVLLDEAPVADVRLL